jgi:hypothetical protein
MQYPSLCPPMAINNIIYPPYPLKIPCYGSLLAISLPQPLRETREGWSLLTVKTEANGGLKEYK